ncbi:MAG: BtpA/SgcQ family protein [Candidatus Bathyarchaeia archaeon]
MSLIEETFKTKKAVIGVIHLPPLPGSPRYMGKEIGSIVERALKDAKALSDGGANVYIETMVTDQGIIEPCAYRVQMAKKIYHAADVKVFADIHVKHGASLTQRPLETVAEEALKRGLADAIILTGPSTGMPPLLDDVKRVRDNLPNAPIIIGSGCSPENIYDLFRLADAAIVGSYFRGGDLSAPISKDRVEKIMAKVREIRKEWNIVSTYATSKRIFHPRKDCYYVGVESFL